MYQRHKLGQIGEELASKYLEKQGYRIIQRNFRCKSGEIDIIAIDNDELVFIEVKTRASKLYGEPSEAVDENKRKHIYKTAAYYLHITKRENWYTRIDVIEVYLYKNTYYIHQIKQVL